MSDLWNDLTPRTEGVCKDISLKDAGKILLKLRMEESPGLNSLLEVEEMGKPLQGVRISGCLHLTGEVGCLITTLNRLGATVRWASSNPFSAHDGICAALKAYHSDNTTIFAWKGETIEEYWWCVYQSLRWPGPDGPNLIVDDGCGAYNMIKLGVDLERMHAKDGSLLNPADFDENDRDTQCLIKLLNKLVVEQGYFWEKLASQVTGLSEETTSGVTHFRNIWKKCGLLFPVMSTNDCVTKQKYDNIYGCRHSGIHGFFNGADGFLIGGKTAVVIGYGNVGKGIAQGFRGQGANVKITEIDPICALQAAMDGYDVVLLEDVVETADIFISCTGGIDIITVEHMRRMKNNAILGNIGQGDQEIQMSELSQVPGLEIINIKPGSDYFRFPDTGKGVIILAYGRLYNLGCANGHPAFVMSASFTDQTLCLLELWRNRDNGKYGKCINRLPKILDETVARYHLKALNVKLTVPTAKQCKFLGIQPEGPFKEDTYHY
ncbi:adenosylhomocysteinase [Babesia ovata]|uniref:Adenosylhomocysteinase n=1 Tax=Babesia ovata TaxID=189622 RepID=A0A2H6KE46_9APIC|nr:adenosylhomocysteinase [Babesia ovata]GBE61257.1 adenosylhomocysteinase [Babesia ovata]